MPRGGARPGAGRKPGKTKASNAGAAKLIDRAVKAGSMMPLDVMLKAMREAAKAKDWGTAADYAAKAAPYVHPRLQAIEHSGEIISSHEQALSELEKLAQGGVEAVVAAQDDELDDRVIN